MPDINKIKENLKKSNVTHEKLFDYILSVSNNQKHILRHFVNKVISGNDALEDIINKTSNREYIISLISKQYTSIRSIKHFFNKVLTKDAYLKNKKISNINYDELIVICLLSDIITTSFIDIGISSLINGLSLKDEEKIKIGSESLKILNESNQKNIFSFDYYIYLYNFIDESDILNSLETNLYNLTNDRFFYENTEKDINNIISILDNDNVRIDKIYNEIYLYLDDYNKLIFMGSNKFHNYFMKFERINRTLNMLNIYQNKYVYMVYDKLNLTNIEKIDAIKRLTGLSTEYENSKSEESYEKYKNEFILFLENLRTKIFDFELKKLFSLIIIDEQLYNLIFKDIKYENYYIGHKLLLDNFIVYSQLKDFINADFINEIEKLNKDVSYKIKSKLVLEEIPIE
jgi:hypothetical protein